MLSAPLEADGPPEETPSEGRRRDCSLRFASAGLIIQRFRRQRGILGAQTRTSTRTPGLWRHPLFLANNVFTLMSVMLGRPRGVFFNLRLCGPIPPLSLHRFCPLPMKPAHFLGGSDIPKVQIKGLILFKFTCEFVLFGNNKKRLNTCVFYCNCKLFDRFLYLILGIIPFWGLILCFISLKYFK